MVAAVARERRVVERRELLAAVEHRAAGGHVEPAQNVEQRALAAARRAQQHDELARVQIQVDAAQGVHVDLAHVIDLGDLPRGEDRSRWRARRRAAAGITQVSEAAQAASNVSRATNLPRASTLGYKRMKDARSSEPTMREQINP